MTTLTVRHAWLQKHPTPTAATGEFHWHPASALGGAPAGDLAQASIAAVRASAHGLAADAPAMSRVADGELRLSLVDRLRGVVPPAALWQLAPGRVVWAQVFAATAPGDGRRYCGLAVTIAEAPGVSAADLLASMVVPPAAPWSGEPAERGVALHRIGPAPLSSTQRSHRDAVLPAVTGVVRALINGGVANVEDPARPDLPAWIASLEAWLPATLTARPRQGEWRGRSPRVSDLVDPVAATMLAAWCPPDAAAAPRTRRAWAVLCELAASQGRTLDDTAAEILAPGADAVHRALSRDERARLPAADAVAIAPWIHAIHHWGRGRLDGAPAVADAEPVLTRLADLVIAQALVGHVAGDDRAALDHVRWAALLPATRRRALLATILTRAPSLAALIEREPRRRASTTARRPEVPRA